MFNLNKIIYYLFLILLLEIGLFVIYRLTSNFLNEKKVIIPILKEEVFVLPLIIKKVTPIEKIVVIEKVAPKISKVSVVLKKEESKSLEEVLIHVSPNSELDIVSMENPKVQPIIYTKSIKLSDLSIRSKKKTFINMLIPSILVAKHRMVEERRRVAKLLKFKKLSDKDSLWLMKKRHIFKASTIDELYDKMKLHPTSIVIAQAIIESGWGTSRFFEKANNVFGIWSFNEHEKRIAASKKRGNHTVYLKKYTSVEQSISDYFLLLSTKDVYQDFREKRLESQDPFVLIEQLGKYSELGKVYIENLKNTIKKNKLLVYDSYSLDI